MSGIAMTDDFDDTQAISEGWGLFWLDPPIHEDEPLQLEAVANDEIGPEVFDDDEEAVAFVVAQAEAGSEYHLAALSYLAAHSPRELTNFPSIAEVLARQSPAPSTTTPS